MTPNRFVLSLVAALAAGCATTEPMKLSEPSDEMFRPRPAEAGYPAVMLRAERFVDWGPGRTTVREIRELLILRPEALILANLLWPLPREAEFPEVFGRTLPGPAADPVRLSSGFVRDFDWVRQSELDDALLDRGIMAAFPEVSVGSVVQLYLTYGLPFESVHGSWGLGATLPTRRARLQVRIPSQVNVEWRARAFDVRVERATGDRNVVVAETRDYVPEQTFEPFGAAIPSPRIQWVARSVTGPYGNRFGIYDSWSKVAELFRRGIEERLADAEPVAARALKDRAPADRVGVVFQFVQDVLRDETRPWAGRSRSSPGDVLARGQASRDERAFSMYAILEETGMNARIGVVLPPREPRRDAGPRGGWSRFVDPGVLQGDYIVVVEDPELGPEGTSSRVFLDPACRRCAAGEVALEHAGRDLAVFDPDGSTNEVEWVTLPDIEVEDVGIDAYHRITPAGLVAREWTQVLDPVRSRSLRQWLWEQPADPKQSDAHFRRTLGVPWGGELELDAPVEPGTPIEVELRDVDFLHTEMAIGDEAIALPLTAFAKTDWMDALLASPNPRRTDVFLGTAGRYRSSVTLSAPEGFRIEELPESFSVEADGAAFSRRVSVNEDATVRVELTADVSPRWPAQRFSELRAFVERVRRSCDDELFWRRR